jgi:beta-glucanase (GH16 family)
MKRILLAVFTTVMLLPQSYADEWKLVWSDEFDYTGLPNTNKWDFEEGFIRNSEKQYYTRERKENVRVENGVLLIEGRKESFKNPKHNANSQKTQNQQEFAQYTSGSINTMGKFDFKYGRIEVRAKLPRGSGVWPAIWLMGTNRTVVGWPRCGEVDIMEYVGKEPHTIHANNHFADPAIQDKSLKGNAIHKSSGGGKLTIKEPFKDFHVYAIEWDEKQIQFFVDNNQYATLTSDVAGKGADNPFRKPHYLLLNLALGGSWGGKIDDSVLPQKFEIDYVRAFKAKNNQQSPAGDIRKPAPLK